MKKLLVFLFLLFPFIGFMQDSTEVDTPKIVTRVKVGKDLNFGTKSLKFIKIIEDSRCPKGTDCMWAGEAKALIGFYENKTLIEEKVFVFGTQGINKNKTKEIFAAGKKTIYGYAISPYPLADQLIDPKNYYLELFIKEN